MTPRETTETTYWDLEDLHLLAELPRVRRWASNWIHLVLLMNGPKILHLSNRGIFRSFGSRPLFSYHAPKSPFDFDATLGYPGEGPFHQWTSPAWIFAGHFVPSRCWTFFLVCVVLVDFPVLSPFVVSCSAMPIQPRNAADVNRAALRAAADPLQEGRRVTDVTSSMRRTLLASFLAWTREEGIEWDTFLRSPHQYLEEINLVLTTYGRALHRAGRPLQHYSETINAIATLKPTLKRHLQMAWSLGFGWVQWEPSTHHVAMPFQVLMSLLTLCLAWGWFNVGGCLALGWGAFLRAGEMIAGFRRDLQLPRDVQFSVPFALFSIQDPKTRNVAARHQCAKLDIPDLLDFLDITFGDFQPRQRLWPHAGQTLRLRLKALMSHIGLPTATSSGHKPLDLGSLRAGGATWGLTMTENPEMIRRRGRWINAKTMEIYIQELAAAQYLGTITEAARTNVFTLARAFPLVLKKALQLQTSGIPKSAWRFLYTP